jgi:hypothetical protein
MTKSACIGQHREHIFSNLNPWLLSEASPAALRPFLDPIPKLDAIILQQERPLAVLSLHVSRCRGVKRLSRRILEAWGGSSVFLLSPVVLFFVERKMMIIQVGVANLTPVTLCTNLGI